jgi:chaperonin GroEL
MAAYALLVCISQFTDPRLAKLNAPRGDVEALAQVLQDPLRGGFDNVATCIDQDAQTIRDQLAALLDDRNPDDMVLLYYSGHGIMTKGQRLFLATGQTTFDRPQARSLSALEMRDMLEQSRAGKQVVILDCCHSGAFVDGAKGVAQTITDDTFGTDNAEGQYVLTATDALQFAYDMSGTLRESTAPAALSRFTGWLVDAIGKGQAAPDSDRITLDAVFDYLSRRARVEAAGMTPKRFVKRNSGEMIIARNPLAQPGKLPGLPREMVRRIERGARPSGNSESWRRRRAPESSWSVRSQTVSAANAMWMCAILC